jgi:uncharacterized protein GlcG (DUF336 family)
MTSDEAKRILEAARVKANEIGKPVTVAIVDPAGTLVILERLNNAGPVSAATSEGKAVGSALTGMPSARLMQMAKDGSPLVDFVMRRSNGRIMPQQGALPVMKDGVIIGAVGVGGATSEEDEQIAKAGVDAL